MAARKLFAATVAGLALAGCDPLPKPLYTEYTPPAAFRTEAMKPISSWCRCVNIDDGNGRP